MGVDRNLSTSQNHVAARSGSQLARVAVTLFLVACVAASCVPPAPSPTPPRSATPTTTPKPPGSPDTTCQAASAGTASTQSTSGESVSSQSKSGGSAGGPYTGASAGPTGGAPTSGLSPDEAYVRAFEAADQADVDRVAGAEQPSPVAVTSVDQSGRPQIRQVSATDVNSTTAAAVSAVEASLLAGEAVLDVEADVAVTSTDSSDTRAAAAFDDPLREFQWALDRFRFEDAARAVTGEEKLRIAVVDSGVATDHPDLAGVVVASQNFTAESICIPGSHGTHVAGIIAAKAHNSIGVRGATPDARLLNVKVLNSLGDGYMADVAAGVIWSVDHGAKVVNLSLAGQAPSTAMSSALDYAEAKGVVVVAAAGNDGVAQKRYGVAENPMYSWPAADPLTIAVASLDESGEVSEFSTNAPYVDVAAPGAAVLSTTVGGTYLYKFGTSMATPYVSALAALTIAAAPGLTPAQVRNRITTQATDIGPAGFDDASGYGKINLAPLLATP